MASSTCAAWGNANREDARFCGACGRPLLARCRSCGAELSHAARFCESCGRPASDDPPASDGALKVVAENLVMVDHRRLGWDEQRGLERTRELLESAFSISPDLRFEIDEILACDERVIAMRIAFRGHAGDGSGELEYLVGDVAVVEGDKLVSVDFYDYDDDAAMPARYTELGGRRER